MYLNTIQPAPGSRPSRKRVGRGPGSGIGKTAGRGQKGQKSRSGGSTPIGFEGGQMPLQRRLPKRGFRSLTRRKVAEIRLHELQGLEDSNIDLTVLMAAGLVARNTIRAKVILSGTIDRSVTLKGLLVTKGAKAAIEQAGGTVEV